MSERPRNELGILQPTGFPPLPAHWKMEFQVFDSGGARLAGYHFMRSPANGRERVLFIVHGLGEHFGRYLHVPHYLDSVLSRVSGLDLRGHGRSEGLRGYVANFDDYVNDVAEFIQHTVSRLTNPEVHLLGHSMGGLIALRLLHLHPQLKFKSATISAPLLGTLDNIPLWKLGVAHLMDQVWGKLQMTNTVDPRHLSHDPHVVETYLKDRLVHSKATPRFFFGLRAAMRDTLGITKGLRVPLLFVIPQADQVVDSSVGLKFAETLEHIEKKIVVYDSFFHESFNEIEKEKPFAELSAWIRAHSES